MSLSTYQKVFSQTGGIEKEELINYKEEGYSLKFADYFLWRLTAEEIFEAVKSNCDSNELNLDFISNSIPFGEGDDNILEANFIANQMSILLNGISKTLSETEVESDNYKLLERAKDDAEKMTKLCNFCITNNFSIAIYRDA
jgi:hypothetical protein